MFVKLKCKSNDQTKLQNNCIILTSRLINIKTSSFLHYFRRQHLKSTEIVISTSISISTNKKNKNNMINIINSRGNILTIIIILKMKKNSNKIKNIVNNKENCITTIIITLHTSARVPESHHSSLNNIKRTGNE